MSVDLLLFIAAAICFGVAAFGVPTGRFQIMALGLLFWVLTHII